MGTQPIAEYEKPILTELPNSIVDADVVSSKEEKRKETMQATGWVGKKTRKKMSTKTACAKRYWSIIQSCIACITDAIKRMLRDS